MEGAASAAEPGRVAGERVQTGRLVCGWPYSVRTFERKAGQHHKYLAAAVAGSRYYVQWNRYQQDWLHHNRRVLAIRSKSPSNQLPPWHQHWQGYQGHPDVQHQTPRPNLVGLILHFSQQTPVDQTHQKRNRRCETQVQGASKSTGTRREISFIKWSKKIKALIKSCRCDFAGQRISHSHSRLVFDY